MPISAASSLSTPTAESSRWPNRWHYALAGCFFLTLAMYGSLVPLVYRPLDLATAVQRFTALFTQPTARLSRTDLLVNVVLFIPVSFCWLAALTPAGVRTLPLLARAAAVLFGCTLASVLIEFSQMWFVRRTASAYDVYAQIVGTTLGLTAWIAGGRSLTDWLRSRNPAHARLISFAVMLAAYYAGLLFYWMLPLDLTIRPPELLRKYRDGRLSLRPFAEVNSLAAAVDQVTTLAAFVPVGMLAVVLFTSQRRPLRTWVGSLAVAVPLVALVWTAGFLTVSRFSSATQLVMAGAGAIVGIGLARWWLRRFVALVADETTVQRRDRFWPLILAALVYSALLVVLFCAPDGENLRPITDGQLLQRRFQSMFRPPLASLYHGSIFNAVKEVVRKVGLFLPLGAMLALACQSLHLPPNVHRLFLAGAILWGMLLGLGMELVQVVVPGHVPDLTDAGLYTIGCAAGVFLVVLFRKNSAERT